MELRLYENLTRCLKALCIQNHLKYSCFIELLKLIINHFFQAHNHHTNPQRDCMCYLQCCCSQTVAVLAVEAVNHSLAVSVLAVTPDHKNSVFCIHHFEPELREGVWVDKLLCKSDP